MAADMEANLHQWANNLSSRHKLFSHDQPLAPHHFSILLQEKNLKPCFSFLARHVVPPDQGRLIKLNLKHARIRKSLKEEAEEPSSLHDYLRLKTAILDARTAIAAETKEISRLGQKKEELRQSEVEAWRKMGLVRAAQQDKEQLTHHYGQWSAQLTELQEDQQREERKVAKANLAIKDRVHNDLMQLERVHQALLSSSSSSSSRPYAAYSLHQMKEGVWERIGESVDELSPRGLVEAVVGETRDGQHALRTFLQGVDLTRDAHELRVKCENDGTFIDEMNPSGVMESVQELLRQMSAAHVKLYLQAHQENRAALSLTRALNTLTNNITTVAKRNHEDEEVVAAVVTLIKTRYALAGEHAALTAAQTLTSTLQDQADTAARIHMAVKEKHARIRNFEKEIQEKVENIQSLAESVRGGRETVRQLLASLRSNIKEVLSFTTTPTPSSTNLAQECERLEAIPLAYLLTTQMEMSGERKQKVSMSTTPLVWHNTEAANAGWKAVSQLCDGTRCWDSVYEVACKYLHLTTTYYCQVERLISLQESLCTARKQSEAISSQGTKELVKRVEAHDRKLEEEVTVMLDDTEKQLTKGFQHLAKFNQHMSDWWEQPAKNIQLKS
ncbi:uncharacterized protein LOC123499723 [Portunus trituberculatus]|nr:uncharacterized protein LOC123499723 [Portunus trituberculatus]XP_045104076.1 uncharacterized protein LOC123499723 [Portunus trituberculatus]XP_045104078.1 uncharacterized protein LOC123499723 [Portunus trituberculatus]XP_045104079.1 uncharacterized protein LOC123499723 [Portunus trituberculatus]